MSEDRTVEKSCLTCQKKHTCLKRGAAIFLLFIQTGRYEEAREAQENANIAGECESYIQK